MAACERLIRLWREQNFVVAKSGIVAHEDELFHLCLGDQHSIEWIFVVPGKRAGDFRVSPTNGKLEKVAALELTIQILGGELDAAEAPLD